MTDRTVSKILKYKAKAMRTSPEYLTYVDEMLREAGISDLKEAFIMGAIDAMLGGSTYSRTDRNHFKMSILKEITKQ